MKNKLVMSCCALTIALVLPLDALALQGENIAFERLDPILDPFALPNGPILIRAENSFNSGAEWKIPAIHLQM